MFLKAGAISLALLVASRLLGLARESVQAAAFGTSGMADVAVLMLTLPDWITGVVASGALAYVLVPAWAGQSAVAVNALQRRVLWMLIGGGCLLGLAVVLARESLAGWLAPGLSPALRSQATWGLVWSAVALPLALVAALGVTRLQHERDFVGMYAANLVVNGLLVAGILVVAHAASATGVVGWLGFALIAAMLFRLAWLWCRRPSSREDPPLSGLTADIPSAPPVGAWTWAVLAAGLPLALPFTARSLASTTGEGALATFNYAWKLVELPLVLAIQLVASLAFPAIAAALSPGKAPKAAVAPVRSAFALAWAFACTAAAALLVGAPALADLLFGWGRMDNASLAKVAAWGQIAAWGLLPQAVIAVGVAVLASRGQLMPVAASYGVALLVLPGAVAALASTDGATLFWLLNGLFCAVAAAVVAAMGPLRRSLPWGAMAAPALGLGVVGLLALGESTTRFSTVTGLAAAVGAAAFVLAISLGAAPELRRGLRR